jgi:hypothetical protein
MLIEHGGGRLTVIKKDLNLQEFFYEEIRGAVENQGLEVMAETEYYLVQLLTHFSSSDSFFHKNTSGYEQETLFSLLERAQEAERSQVQIQIFKRLGDLALYVAGYFPESFSHKIIGQDYYISMGGRAYNNVSNLLSLPAVQVLYEELSSKFIACIDVLNEVSARGKKHCNHDLLKLYENWLQTGSRHAETLLKDQGIIPHLASKEQH